MVEVLLYRMVPQTMGKSASQGWLREGEARPALPVAAGEDLREGEARRARPGELLPRDNPRLAVKHLESWGLLC